MIRYFTLHPTAGNLLMVLFIILGLFVAFQIRRETLPDYSDDEVEITVDYPGASPEEVEQSICLLVEDALDTVSNIDEITSEAKQDKAVITVKMLADGNFQEFTDDIRTEVFAIDDFPDLAEEPVIQTLNKTDPVIDLAVTGPMSVPDLKIYCQHLKTELQRLPQVSLVEIKGFSDHQLLVELDREKLMSYGLSVENITRIISEQDVNLPSGTLKTTDQDILLQFTDRRQTIPELENIIVMTTEEGNEIHLGDIAKITDRFELDEDQIYFNDKRAGVLKISKTKIEDCLRVLDAVKAFVKEKQASAPPGVKFNLTQDASTIVRDRLHLVVVNGIQGLILVFITLWLFFSFRFSFWVVMGLPVSIIGSLFIIYQIGYSLNMFSMMAILIALGMLMDDAIVISENVASHFSKGKTAVQAVIDGISEVTVGVISSFITTICVFGILGLMIRGNVGKVLQVVPVVLIIILAVSLIEAFTILPHHLGHSIKPSDLEPGRFKKKFNDFIEWVREVLLGRLINRLIDWRYLFCGFVLALFLISLSMIVGGYLKFTVFPDLDSDTIVCRILLPQGTPLEKTEEVVNQVTTALEKVNKHFPQPDQKDLIKAISTTYNENSDAYENGPHVATVYADLLSGDSRNTKMDDILNLWREETGECPDVLSLKFKDLTPGPGGRPIDIRIYGDDLDQLKTASIRLQHELNTYKGVLDLSDDLRPGKPQRRYQIREGALKHGLTTKKIADQLRSAVYSETADKFQIGPEAYEVDVCQLRDRNNELASLDNFHVTLDDGKQVPLSTVVKQTSGRGYARIARKNGRRYVAVQGDVDKAQTNRAQIFQKLKTGFLPQLEKDLPGIQVGYDGEAKEMSDTGDSIIKSFILGVIGIFIMLSFQFRSYFEPLIVMVAIPLTLIGVIWGHLLMGYEFSMPSAVGFVSLAGIVVNDSILLVEFIKIKRREGVSVDIAAKNASKARFRAVILTSLTTIAGLLPLMTEKSMQAQVLIPLAITIVFGLLASTVLVLLVIPTLYTIADDFGLTSAVEEHSH